MSSPGSPRSASRWCRTCAPASFIACALMLAGCGDDSAPAPKATVRAAPAPASAAAPEPVAPPLDPAARPAPPERNFRNRRTRPDGYEELAPRFKPGYEDDRWDTEVVAALDERTTRLALEAALAGDPTGFGPRLAERFEGTTALSPREPELLRDSGGVRVLRADALPEETYDAAGAASRVLELVSPLAGAREPSVVVQVTEALQRAQAEFQMRSRVRLAGRRGEGAVQVSFVLETTWALREGLQLAAWRASEYERVELARTPFADLTRSVLAEAPRALEELDVGALETAGRHDRLNPASTSYLGMNGMAVGDLDGDGREDVYVGLPAGRPNLLLLHTGGHGAREAAAEAGVDFLDETAGVLVLDLDGDGARDIVLGIERDIVIAWNDGSGRFPERTVLEREGSEKVYSISAADADGDGDLDLYDTRYFRGRYGGGVPVPYHDAQNGGINLFWRNQGERRFVEDTVAAGLDAGNGRFSLASVWEDLDGDGDLDLYVTNDFGRNNLYRNDGGTFTDVATEAGAFDMAAGMGVACADVELDGDVDLYVSNMFTAAGRRVTAHPKFMPGEPPQVRAVYAEHTRGNSLLMNAGDGTFADATQLARVGPGGWTWGAVFTDFDSDGLPDLFVPNGFLSGRIEADLASFFWRCVVNASPLAPPASEAYERAWFAVTELSQVEGLSWNGAERGYAYWNLGEGRFADASAVSGLDAPDDGRVACVVDWDTDGRPDLWVKNRTAPLVRFMHNRHSSPGAWIGVELADGAPNTEAVGALVTVTSGERVLRRRVYAGEGFLGGSSRRLVFGLGTESGAAEGAAKSAGEGAADAPCDVHVLWPDGGESTYPGLAPGKRWRVRRGSEPVPFEAAPSKLAAAQAGPLTVSAGEPRARVPLLARLPLANWPLPRFGRTHARVGTLSTGPLLVVAWGSWDGGGEAALSVLAARRAEFAALGLELFPLSLDGVRDEAHAHALAASLGLAEPGGRADRETQQLLEVFLLETLGPYEDLPLPVGLLFDPESRLACLYVGALEVERILEDARALPAADPAEAWPAPLMGGRWARPFPTRAFAELAGVVRPRGMPELASELEQAAVAEGR